MSRRPLLAAAFLTMLAGCEDGQRSLTGPDDSPALSESQVVVSSLALHAVWDILDDPLLQEAVEASGVDERRFHRVAADMTAVHVREDLGRLTASVRSGDAGDGESDATAEIMRAVLELMLDDAEYVAASHFENESTPALHTRRR